MGQHKPDSRSITVSLTMPRGYYRKLLRVAAAEADGERPNVSKTVRAWIRSLALPPEEAEATS